MKHLRHILIPAAVLLFCIIIPILTSDAFALRTLRGDKLDADVRPAGDYVVYINAERHPGSAEQQVLAAYLRGGHGLLPTENYICEVAMNDAGARQLARNLQAGLPEGQVEIRREDAMLLVSRAETGRYDLLILSKPLADALGADSLSEKDQNIEVIVGETL